MPLVKKLAFSLDPNKQDETGATALHYLAQAQYIHDSEQLEHFHHGEINNDDSDEDLPTNYYYIIIDLIKQSTNLNLQDENGHTVFNYIHPENYELVDCLLDHGADPLWDMPTKGSDPCDMPTKGSDPCDMPTKGSDPCDMPQRWGIRCHEDGKVKYYFLDFLQKAIERGKDLQQMDPILYRSCQGSALDFLITSGFDPFCPNDGQTLFQTLTQEESYDGVLRILESFPLSHLSSENWQSKLSSCEKYCGILSKKPKLIYKLVKLLEQSGAQMSTLNGHSLKQIPESTLKCLAHKYWLNPRVWAPTKYSSQEYADPRAQRNYEYLRDRVRQAKRIHWLGVLVGLRVLFGSKRMVLSRVPLERLVLLPNHLLKHVVQFI